MRVPGAGSSSSWPTTRSSTGRRRAATRAMIGSSGFVAMTSTPEGCRCWEIAPSTHERRVRIRAHECQCHRQGRKEAEMTTTHRVESTIGGASVNAYLIEGERGVVAVDSTLSVSGGRQLRDRVKSIGKPLDALVLTHAHP